MRRLRHTNRLSPAAKVGFALLYLLIVLVAFSPYVYYITPQRVGWLAVMAMVVFGFQAYVTLRTAAVITSAPLPHTELLTLTPLSRWQIVVGKWWGGFKTVWPWYVLAAIPKVGLSLGVMNYMHVEQWRSIPMALNPVLQPLISPYLYVSHNAPYDAIFFLYPSGTIVILSFTIIIAFSIFHVALFNAIAVFARSIYTRLVAIWILGTFFLIILLMVGGHFQKTMLMTQVKRNVEYFGWNYGNLDYTHFNRGIPYYVAIQDLRRWASWPNFENHDGREEAIQLLNSGRAIEAHSIGVGAILDGGLMLTINISRPMLWSENTSDRCLWLGVCASSYHPSQNPENAQWKADFIKRMRQYHFRFLLRHMASAAYGMVLHIVLTLTFLGLAARRHP
ncbi:MAG: hypothetical protein AAFU54_15305 [Chloroflexota bacterium]